MFNKKTIITIISAAVIFFSSAGLVFFLAKRTGNKAIVNNTNSSIIDELKNNNPGFSNAQLKFYAEAAAKGSIGPCLGRDDENVCVASVASIKGDRSLCYELDHISEKLYEECTEAILMKKGKEEISRCALLSGDDYYNCLWAIFNIYKAVSDCAGLTEPETLAACQDFFNYRTVFYKYDRTLCKIIKNEKLNLYCLKNITD